MTLVICYLSVRVCQDFGTGGWGVCISVCLTRLRSQGACGWDPLEASSLISLERGWETGVAAPSPQLAPSLSLSGLSKGGFRVAQRSEGACPEKEPQAQPWRSCNVTSTELEVNPLNHRIQRERS